jgi:hypothetical protein
VAVVAYTPEAAVVALQLAAAAVAVKGCTPLIMPWR